MTNRIYHLSLEEKQRAALIELAFIGAALCTDYRQQPHADQTLRQRWQSAIDLVESAIHILLEVQTCRRKQSISAYQDLHE